MNEFAATLEYVGIDGDRTLSYVITTDLTYEGLVEKIDDTLSYAKWFKADVGTGTVFIPAHDVKSVTVNRPVPAPTG